MYERGGFELYGEDKEIFNGAHNPFFGGVWVGYISEPTLIRHFFNAFDRIGEFYQTFRHISSDDLIVC